ncbi:MAG: DoxX family protein [Aquincola tertiaricarbonis]|uniref:DoxX family protein n=1 Tax=Aquincola TaxID=391952 RepID=UPI000614F45F|nr:MULTISPECIES: DoxX family protein [Aquincola]MCR5868544.1 DoxX family protein [Aquincola sp. J276]
MGPALEALRHGFVSPAVHWLALLLLCGAYLQGAVHKLRHFEGAIAEMRHFGLAPAAPWAVATIGLEIGASALVLTGWHRWLGALLLGGFTVVASFLADRFWVATAAQRLPMANAFFEHWGLAGGFMLVAWLDLGGHLGV